jgi:hypothetical protein
MYQHATIASGAAPSGPSMLDDRTPNSQPA